MISLIVCSTFLIFMGYVLGLYLTLPDLREPGALIATQSTVITDRSGVELYRLFREQDRTFVARADLPKYIEQALIAIEDERFYEHGCIDPRAILRALFANVLRGYKSQGASTLTQQLARNALLTREKRLSRKIKEVLLACALERQYTKDQLLELYLNWIPFGQNAYGIEQASRAYFGISAKDLSLAQAAVLASLPQRPSFFNPYGPHLWTRVSDDIVTAIRQGDITNIAHIPEDKLTIGLLGRAVGSGSLRLPLPGRTDVVLRKMQGLGFISEQERLTSLADLAHITFQPYREDIRAPHFVLWVRAQVETLFAAGAEEGLLERGGLRIETTLDWELQRQAEETTQKYAGDMGSVYGAHNIAIVAMDSLGKDILAYVGNTDYGDDEHQGKIDMAQAPRQPGSSFKPITYAAAFQKGFGPATVLYDVPTKFGDDEPQNFDGRFWGPLTIRRALGSSRNIPAIKAFFLAGGEEHILQLAARLGAPTPKVRKLDIQRETGSSFAYGWPLAIGAAETPLLEMVHAYSTFASGGQYRPLQSIRRITDRHGNLLYEAPVAEAGAVLDPRIAFAITSILSDTDARPPENAYWRSILTMPGLEAAAKTGTSNQCLKREDPSSFAEASEDKKDAKDVKEKKEEGACIERRPDNLWTIGYTPRFTVGVWVGNASHAPLSEKAESLVTAAPIWKDFLSRILRVQPDAPVVFPVPPGLIQPQVSLLSGQLPTTCTPVTFRKADLFLEEAPPTLPDPACVRMAIDRVTLLLASESCPTEAREEQSFLVAKSVLPERWPLWEEGVQEWVREHMVLWNATPNHSGSLLPLPLVPTEKCDLAATPGRLEKPSLHVEFPQANALVPFPSFRPEIAFNVGSRLRDVRFSVDGKLLVAETGSLSPILTMPKSIKPSGTHTLDITVIDQYFNEAKKTVLFRFVEDHSPPNIRFISPPEGLTIRAGADILLHAEASDAEGGIKHIQFFLNDRLLSNDPLPPYELSHTANLKPGTYTLKARATDLAGNSVEDTIDITIVP